VSEDSFQRMQQFPVIAALMKELHVAIQKTCRHMPTLETPAIKMGRRTRGISRRSGVQRCLTTVRLNRPRAPKQCAVQSFLNGGAAVGWRVFISEPFLISVPKQ